MILYVQLPDGRYRNFFVKKVKRDTLAWKAGIQPGDKIVQVGHRQLDECNCLRDEVYLYQKLFHGVASSSVVILIQAFLSCAL